MNKQCPNCGQESMKVIYYGLPMKFCSDEECNTMFGFWSFICPLLPFNGWLFVYEGSYIYALYLWLFKN